MVYFQFCYLEELHTVLELVTSLENISLTAKCVCIYTCLYVFPAALHVMFTSPVMVSANTTNTFFPRTHKEREQQM